MLGKQASKSGQLNFEVKVVWIHSSHIITLFVLPSHYIDPTRLDVHKDNQRNRKLP